MSRVELRIERAASPPAAKLIAALDADILRRYPGLPVNGIEAMDFEAAGGVFVVAYVEETAAACGAFRPYGEAVEVKRMYVHPDFRGRGLAKRILQFLESEAARRGFTRAILETGNRQPEAIGLYAAAGWQPIAPFGRYAESTSSVCFEKRLVPAG
jgi:GNAT superfamily N-acetyltransferase